MVAGYSRWIARKTIDLGGTSMPALDAAKCSLSAAAKSLPTSTASTTLPVAASPITLAARADH